MFRNILVPTDGSALSRKAIKQAINLAKKTGSKITGLHVAPAYRVTVYADYVPPDLLLPKDYEERVRVVSTKHLKVIKQAAEAAGVPYSGRYVSSDYPADAIVKAAKKYKCDLIAMASHGRSGLSKLLIGSETQKVLANTRVAVLVLR